MSDGLEIDIVKELGAQPIKRPDGIEKDVNHLSQKKRVSNILSSPYFKEELEQAVTDVICSNKEGGPNSIAKEIANFFSPSNPAGFQGVGCVSPINDLTGSEAIATYSKMERLLRCKLATLYRIVDLFGWSKTINDHISVRLNKEHEHFLVNPHGLLYHEVSAAKLLKVNMQGDVLDPGSTSLTFSKAGFSLLTAIHAARPDLNCIVHIQTPDVVAVSCMECGIIPISQEALMIGDVATGSYSGAVVTAKERKALQKNLGATSKVMILRNRGIVACGETIEEASLYLHNTVIACCAQVKAMSCLRAEKLIQIDRSTHKLQSIEQMRSESKNNFAAAAADKSSSLSQNNDDDDNSSNGGTIRWKVGEMQFEALVRMLDNMGYRSGYTYRNPNFVKSKSKFNNEVEEPPMNSPPISREDLENVRGCLKRTEMQSKWVNSPNMYMKVEHESDGDSLTSGNEHSSPGRTKWLQSSATASSKSASSVRTNANQFVPTGTDAREVAVTRNSIRGQAIKHKNPSGPQSQILQSVAPKSSSQQQQQISTASKGIIERGVEVNIVRAAGPPNPFSKITNRDLEEYKRGLLKPSSELTPVVQHPEEDGDRQNCKEKSSAEVIINEEVLKETADVTHTITVESIENREQAPMESGGKNFEEVQQIHNDEGDAEAAAPNMEALRFPTAASPPSVSSNEPVGSEEEVTEAAKSKKLEAKKKKKKRPLSFLKKKKNK